MTNKKFDFGQVGKRMPYATPDGFFDQLEEDVWKEVKGDSAVAETVKMASCEAHPVERKPFKMRLLMRWVMAVAATIALVLVVHLGFFRPDASSPSVQDVDQAFSQLTTDDQAYLLNVYQDDIFIHEQ